jgi:hypothetical protein
MICGIPICFASYFIMQHVLATCASVLVIEIAFRLVIAISHFETVNCRYANFCELMSEIQYIQPFVTSCEPFLNLHCELFNRHISIDIDVIATFAMVCTHRKSYFNHCSSRG